uniref:Uncharacterized protein n=1 Tax=Rhizophora mucronata TaxID=61149 RepID=A0A2P2PH83_RHIMU
MMFAFPLSMNPTLH